MQNHLFTGNTENRTSTRMNFNKFTLAFPNENEKYFQYKYFHNSLAQFRVSFALVAVLYSVFGYLDMLVVKEFANLFFLIRYGIVIPLLIFVFLFSFNKHFIRIWQELIFVCFIVGGAGIAVMTFKAPENYSYYGGMMLVFFAGYFFVKLRFFLATIAGWTTLLFFNIGAIFFSDTETVMIISNNFFFISANLIGMFAAYNIEFYTRRDFFLNQQLDHRNIEIEEANINLESKVEKRTEELVLAKEQAEQSDKLKSAFLANMSHEIRTPMNGILGFAELLKEPDLSGDQQQQYIQIIEKSGARMLNIINDIIDISKIEAGLMKIDLKESNINEQIEYIYTFFSPEVEGKGMKLFFKNSLPKKDAIIITDREKLYAILTNLVKNAIKYTAEGSIEFGYVSTSSTTGPVSEPVELQFYVKDTGIGIPKHKQAAIFERFIQANIDDKKVYQGAGLGLTISKAYVEMLGGEIWVESDPDNHQVGSTFYFTLPFNGIQNEKLVTENKKTAVVEKDQLKKLKILIVEDDLDSEKLLAIGVRLFSKEILIAGTGIDAIKSCRENPDIDLILMDIQMPEMNGYEATCKIREFNTKVIIIAQTAYALSGDKEKALEAGCNDYIAKPIKRDQLLALINKYFNK